MYVDNGREGRGAVEENDGDVCGGRRGGGAFVAGLAMDRRRVKKRASGRRALQLDTVIGFKKGYVYRWRVTTSQA